MGFLLSMAGAKNLLNCVLIPQFASAGVACTSLIKKSNGIYLLFICRQRFLQIFTFLYNT